MPRKLCYPIGSDLTFTLLHHTFVNVFRGSKINFSFTKHQASDNVLAYVLNLITNMALSNRR